MTANFLCFECLFTDKESLYQAYMPFVSGGGLFIRTQENYSLENEVILLVKLPSEPEICKIKGKIVWITPPGSQGSKPAGIGVKFTDENGHEVCCKIENYLGDMLKSMQITDTI